MRDPMILGNIRASGSSLPKVSFRWVDAHAVSQLPGRLHMEVGILRRREVERLTRLSKASIYRKMRTGTFPLPLKLGERAVAWRAAESRVPCPARLPRRGRGELMAAYLTSEGDILDAVCQEHYGLQAGAAEVVLEANPGLADRGPSCPRAS